MSSPDRSESEENFDGNECQSDVESASDPKESRNSSATGQTFNIATRPETYKSMRNCVDAYDRHSMSSEC